ncbi:MAG: hypothetical protein O3B21_04920 [Proteobacteria bacterium]|nr:hypothetical protein [Pseudomonadota bacterium]MDA1355321.1 hypothetical protein [Pseudomonadota bacterium]
MRFIVTASWSVEIGNAAARAGTMGETIQAILENIKPEACYFAAVNGKRSAIMVVDIADASGIPAVAEPWFLAFDASVEAIPVMLPEDLVAAGPAIEAAARKFS